MTDEKIQELWSKATGWDIAGYSRTMDDLRKFTAVVLADERERVKWDGIHTCSDHCDKPACVARRESVWSERRKLAELVEQMGVDGYGTLAIAAAIRARGLSE